jgi:DNA replication and repair protein RecF
MHITHLGLTNFRNYECLELDLPSHLVVFQGDNAQGKTNLLEAIYILATAKSSNAAAERELINWFAVTEELSAARILAQIKKRGGDLQVEIALRAVDPGPEARVQKRIRVNGMPRRAMDLVGQVNVVLFSCQDIDLIGGAPSQRRRYLDMTNSQTNPLYLRALQRYNKVLLQRNHLLKLVGERHTDGNQLDFWDQELLEHGSYIIEQRQLLIAELNDLAQPIHQQLTAAREKLRIAYLPSTSVTDFGDKIRDVREKEVAQGMSLIGPHRDDLAFFTGDVNMNVYSSRGQQRTIALSLKLVNMNVYSSRGQQRTIALSLKLAEARFMLSNTGDEPILLLDDMLSELDSIRRQQVLESIASYQQVVITNTDLDHFNPDFLAEATLFRVREGSIEPL